MILGTWNLENLFRPGSDDGPDEEAYEAKLTELARVISEIGFDVLGVQEVGDPEALEDRASTSTATGTPRRPSSPMVAASETASSRVWHSPR